MCVYIYIYLSIYTYTYIRTHTHIWDLVGSIGVEWDLNLPDIFWDVLMLPSGSSTIWGIYWESFPRDDTTSPTSGTLLKKLS